MKSIVDTQRIDLRDLQIKFVAEYNIEHSTWSDSSRNSIARIAHEGDNYLTSGMFENHTNGFLARLAPVSMFYASQDVNRYPYERKFYELERIIRMTHNNNICVVIGCVYASFVEVLIRRGFDIDGSIDMSVKQVILMEIYTYSCMLEKKLSTEPIVSKAVKSIIENIEDPDTSFVTNIIRDCEETNLTSLIVLFISWITSNMDYSDIPFTNNLSGERHYNSSIVGSIVGALRGFKAFPESRKRLANFDQINELAIEFYYILQDPPMRAMFEDLKPFERHNTYLDELYDKANDQLISNGGSLEDVEALIPNLFYGNIFARILFFAHTWEIYITNPHYRLSIFRKASFSRFTVNSIIWDKESLDFIQSNYVIPFQRAKAAASRMYKKFYSHIKSVFYKEVSDIFHLGPAVTSILIYFGLSQITSVFLMYRNRGMMISLPIPWNKMELERQMKFKQTI